MSVRIIQADVLDGLARVATGSVQTVVTSPPYWGLRDYGVEGQIGLEKTLEEYIEKLVGVFREVGRSLREDGSLWLNLGDCFYSGSRASLKLSAAEAAWLAALIDGEGCIQIHRQMPAAFQVDVGVGMKDRDLVQRAHDITGLGSCHVLNRGVWDWSIRGQQAACLLRSIYPYLILKRRQAALACMLADDLSERKFGKGNPLTNEAIVYRQSIKDAVSTLNQRQSTDFLIHEPDLESTSGLKPKDLVGLPWMLAFALRADGWHLRSDVVWAKPNAMPESTRDRPTRSHEFLFLLTKRPQYFYDGYAIREPAVANHGSGNGYKRDARLSYGGRGSDEPYVPASATFRRTGSKREKPIPGQTRGTHRPDRKDTFPTDFRNKRDVWTINCKAYKGAHLATFPPALVEPCLLAGASQHGCCPACGTGWKRIIKKSGGTLGKSWHDHGHDAEAGMSQEGCAGLDSKTDAEGAGYRVECVGWEPGCGCEAGDPIPCTVMDPFAGSGTVGAVAVRLGYDSILIELKPEYIRLCEERTKAALPP